MLLYHRSLKMNDGRSNATQAYAPIGAARSRACQWSLRQTQKPLVLSRRGFIAGASGLLIATAAKADLIATPEQTMGPFYPRRKPNDSDIDLTRIDGRQERAKGQVIEVVGRVLSVKGTPLSNAIVEIWQADHNGRYHHPYDRQHQKRDKNFQGYGQVRLGKDGAYRFRTIRPRFYDTGAGIRTPHIHFRVVSDKGHELATQMYFPGEKLNGQDFILNSFPSRAARSAVIARLEERDDVPRYHFDLVLA